MISSDIEQYGWVLVPGISDRSKLLELAASLGTPVRSPDGHLVKVLRPCTSAQSHHMTLSKKYGRGAFPFHTDTAFWPLPCRYVVLRVCGDTRRQTFVWPLSEVFEQFAPSLRRRALQSVWTVKTPSRRFYCSMAFRVGNSNYWRYDANCMVPANGAARCVKDLMTSMIHGANGHAVKWSEGNALVILNWKVLHARGPRPEAETNRIVERVYVR